MPAPLPIVVRVLAFASAGDPNESNLLIIVVCVLLVAAVAGLAFVPVALAWARKHRASDAVLAMTLLWALAAAGSVAVTAYEQFKWSKEFSLQISSGYRDPQDLSDKPAWPWPLWGGLATGYLVLIGWAASRGQRQRSDEGGGG